MARFLAYPDIQISRRKRAHVLIDRESEEIRHYRHFGDLLDFVYREADGLVEVESDRNTYRLSLQKPSETERND